MKTHPRILMTVLATAVLAACQSTPPANPALEEARAAYLSASNNPHVAGGAAVELQRARESLTRAENAWANERDEAQTRSLAYVARQRALTATEVGNRHAAEQRVQLSSAERERIRADARTRDAMNAEQRAAAAQSQTVAAQAQAATARGQAASAQAQADMARQRQDAATDRAAAMQRELAELSARNTARGIVVTLQDVLFDTGRAELRSGSQRAVSRLAEVLSKYPERKVLIEGFTDSQGSDSYNMDLAQRRADAVKRALQDKGVPGERIETRAYGEAFSVASNDTAAGRQMNRRVEIIFSDAQGQIAPR